MAGSINTITGAFSATVSWNAQDNPANAPSGVGGILNQDGHAPRRSLANGTGTGNINQGRDFQQYIAAGANVTIDLTAAFTNLVNDTTATFARCKAYMFHLLGPTDDSTLITANGPNSSKSVLIDWSLANGFTRQTGAMGFAGTGNIALTSGDFFMMGANGANSANGVGGTVVDSTHKNIKITNEDASNAAIVRISILGNDA